MTDPEAKALGYLIGFIVLLLIVGYDPLDRKWEDPDD